MNENLIIEQENFRGTFTFRVVFVHLNVNQYDTNWKWKINMWFSILDSFDHSPPVASAFGRRSASPRPTPKNQHAKELLLALWVFRTTPNMEGV